MSKSSTPWLFAVIALAALAATQLVAEDKPAAAPAAPPAPATAPAAGGDKDRPAEDLTPKSPDLAARFASLAQDTLRQKVVVPPHFREAAGLLMAARRLDPNEPRYPRMLYEAMLQLRDTDGALDALRAYRDTRTADEEKNNQVGQAAKDELAMVNYIDLVTRQKETAEDRLAFLIGDEKTSGLLDSGAPDAVKSHVAMRAAQIARERGNAELEDRMIGRALELNPVNLDALRAKLERVTATGGTALERVKVLLAMLKSNPVQPAVTYRLAREFAEAGLAEESLQNYSRTLQFSQFTGLPIGREREFMIGYACELYLMAQPQLLQLVEGITGQMLNQDASDVEALLVRLLAERAAKKTEAVDKTKKQVVAAALNRVQAVRQKLGVNGATTRPVDAPEALNVPDLSADVNTLKDEKFAELREPYAQSVGDLAWYLVYVADQPAEAAKLVPALKELLTDKSPTVVRIEGWIAYAQGNFDQAGIKLKAVADQDIMAQVGNLLLWAKNPAEKAPAVAAGKKLLQEQPAGLLGALLLDRLGELGITKLEPRADAADLKAEHTAFPTNWFDIIGAPQGFYQLRAGMEGGRVRYPFGEPMIARVVIRNTSQFPITIGPEGVIRNDLWFDAQFRGLVQQTVTGAAYERLSQALVLKPGQEVSQTFRFDQGQLAQVLAGNPQPSLMLYGLVRTNPRGDGGTGPCGYGVLFNSITERAGFVLEQKNIQELNQAINVGKPGDKMRALELMSAQVEQLRGQAQNAQGEIVIKGFLENINKVATDEAVPAVATWGQLLTAAHDPSRREATVTKLLEDPDPTRRVLGLFVAHAFPPDRQREIVKRAAGDKDEIVRTYAAAMGELAKLAAGAPTTGPTTAPAPAATPPAGGAAPAPGQP